MENRKNRNAPRHLVCYTGRSRITGRLTVTIQKGTGANRGNGGFQRPKFAPNAFLNPHYSVNARALGRIRFGSVFIPLFSRLSLVQLHCYGLSDRRQKSLPAGYDHSQRLAGFQQRVMGMVKSHNQEVDALCFFNSNCQFRRKRLSTSNLTRSTFRA